MIQYNTIRLLYSRSQESPLFTVESTMNVAVSTVLKQMRCAVSTVKFNYNHQSRSQITPVCPVFIGGECKTSHQTSWVFSPEEAKKNNYRTVKVTDIVIYNLKGSFNTKRFVGPILDSQGSLF